MKKALLLCVTLLAATASIAAAFPGVSLTWNVCFGDGGAINRNFACNSNIGTNSLRGSFELGSDLNRVSGIACVVDVRSATPVLPEWWEFKNPGACRPLALSIAAFDGGNCIDWAVGQASMNIAAYNQGQLGPNTARIRVLNAVTLAAVQNLVAEQEYTAFALNINNTGTVGTTCTGCIVPANIVFNIVQIDTADLTSTVLSGPANMLNSNVATWQGGFVTPTRKSTWSQVKSVYR